MTLWRVMEHTTFKIQTRTLSPNSNCLFYSYTKKRDVIPEKSGAAPAAYVYFYFDKNIFVLHFGGMLRTL